MSHEGGYHIHRHLQTHRIHLYINGCRDVGENVKLRPRSRGVFATVAGGGIIKHWRVLWESEGGAQVLYLHYNLVRFAIQPLSLYHYCMYSGDIPHAGLSARDPENCL